MLRVACGGLEAVGVEVEAEVVGRERYGFGEELEDAGGGSDMAVSAATMAMEATCEGQQLYRSGVAAKKQPKTLSSKQHGKAELLHKDALSSQRFFRRKRVETNTHTCRVLRLIQHRQLSSVLSIPSITNSLLTMLIT